MKTTIKNALVWTLLTGSASISAQTPTLNCQGNKTSIEIIYDKGPRGGDIVNVELDSGEKLQYITKFTSKTFQTRCGSNTYESAGLNSFPFSQEEKGHIDLSTTNNIGFGCGGSSSLTTGTLELTSPKLTLKDKLVCKTVTLGETYDTF